MYLRKKAANRLEEHARGTFAHVVDGDKTETDGGVGWKGMFGVGSRKGEKQSPTFHVSAATFNF